MSHANTARMQGYWEERREGIEAPRRSSIDPAGFCDLVTQAFVLGRGPGRAYPFRLTGALLEDLHGGPLVGSDFVGLWAPPDRARIQAAIEEAMERRVAVIALAHGRSPSGHQARLEILLAPLAGRHGRVDRMLGLYQPVSPLFRLQDQPIRRLFLLELAFADEAPSPVRLASVDGRLIA
jgi:hypothetical protein